MFVVNECMHHIKQRLYHYIHWVMQPLSAYNTYNPPNSLLSTDTVNFFRVQRKAEESDVPSSKTGRRYSTSYLTFRGQCIVIYSYNKTNEMH